MYQIVEKEALVPNIIYLKIRAPKVAKVARPGQFVIIRVDETGERIPMGLSGWDEREGTIEIVFYVLGTSTMKLGTLRVGDSVLNLAGPLGNPHRGRQLRYGDLCLRLLRDRPLHDP